MGIRAVLPVPIVAAALLLGACSSDHGSMPMDPGSGSMMAGDHGGMDPGMGPAMGTGTSIEVPEGADFNAADVTFAQEMIVHHGQAITMAELMIGTSDDPEVLALAEQIQAAQDPEIETMSGWLETWGFEVPDPQGGGHGSGDMGSMGTMPAAGMMTDEEMRRLGDATGIDRDRMFLEMMIRHHEGAIAMAEQLQEEGEYVPAQDLARAIITAQQAEIVTMEALLARG